jgi:hypothetical protein
LPFIEGEGDILLFAGSILGVADVIAFGGCCEVNSGDDCMTGGDLSMGCIDCGGD